MSVSGASASSFGSGIESESGSTKVGPNNADDNFDENASTLESGLFGVLFTVSKEKNPSVWFVAFRLFMDWIQVFLLLVNPQYGWDIDANNKVWQAFSFIQLNYFLTVRGYMFFLVCMYIFAVALAANLGLCIWVSNSFKNNKFDHVWPIVWLRYFSLVFYQVLDIASLTLFLMTMDCQYFPGPTQGYNQEFPDVYCWTMPHMIHVAVAAVAIVIFFVLASIFSMAEIELNPVSKNLMGMAHTRVEVVGFGIKMGMTCVSVFFNNLRWMSVLQLIGAYYLCYLYLRWLPHLTAEVNHVRVATYFSTFWAAFLLIIMAYEPGVSKDDPDALARQQKQLTIALWAGFIPIGGLGAGLSWLRTRYYLRTVANKFKDPPAGVKLKNVFKFEDCRQVELASRVCRRWVDEDTLDDDGVLLAEKIVRAGVQTLSRSPYMAIWWSSFLIDVQGSYQSGYTALQDAKKMPNASFLERFCIFTREQEHTQKASAASSGDNASVDLVSYVEFQRNYRLALRLHYEALLAKRGFWETLLHNQITFNKLADAVQRIEVSVRASEKMYRQVLARHSNSVKILVLYVKFLQNVRNDPWSAAKWSAEAEKLQKAEEEANERAVFGDNNAQSHDDSKGVIIIGANCLMRMVNETAASLLGYGQRAELLGKNINIIVPPPFSRNHNNYVRNYIQTGQAKILDGSREAVALHKDRYVVPIQMFVTKVSGIGEDSVFMGIIQGIQVPKNTATLWLLNGGTVLSCDARFTDWLGCKHEDIHGKPATDMVLNTEVLEDLLSAARHDIQENAKRKPQNTVHDVNVIISSAQQPTWTAYGVQMKHLYLDVTVTVDITMTVGGIGDTATYVCKMVRKEQTSHLMMVTDTKGRITHVTSKLAGALGTTVSKLQAGGMAHALDALLPPPFMKIHHQWYRDKAEVPPAWSCRSQLPMVFSAPGPEGPTPVPFRMHFTRKDLQGKESLNLIQFEECTMEETLNERRLALVLNNQGIVTSASKSPTALFGFDPQALIGLHLAYIVDILNPPMTAHKANDREVLESESKATKMLMLMAEKSYEHPGMSWPVGVRAIVDPVALSRLGPMGVAMMGRRIVPSVMTVDAYMAPPEMDGAKVLLPSEMQLKIELWKTELLSGLLELDTQGNVTQLGLKGQNTSNTHLLLGVPPAMLQGAAFGSIMALHSKSALDALFTEGGLSAHKHGSGPGQKAKGGMRAGGQYSRRRGISPLHTVKMSHGTDHAEVELTVQAVVKQDIGVGCSLYVLVHAAQPRCGRPDFQRWIWDSPHPGLAHSAARRASHRRTSQLALTEKDFNFASHRVQLPKEPSLGLAALPAPPIGHRRSVSPRQEDAAPTPEVGDDSTTPADASVSDPAHRGPLAPVQESPEPMDLSNLQKQLGLAGDDDDEADMITAFKPAPPADSSPRKAQSSVRKEKLIESRKSTGLSKKASRTDLRSSATLQSIKKKAKAKAGDADSDGDSVDSGPTGLKSGGRERIRNWMDTAVSPPESELDDESEEASEDEEEVGEEVQDMDEDVDADELDEAGEAMNDYKRGKRLKKLVKMLMGPQAQIPHKRLKWVAIIVVMALIAVDLAMFMAFWSMVSKQTAQVQDLRASSRAVNRVMQIAISTSALEILWAGDLTGTHLRHLGEDGLAVDVKYQLDLMETRTAQMDEYHRGVYRGFTTTRQLPTAYDLRSTWETPSLPIRTFYQSASAGTFSVETDMSLWDAGNEFIKAARNILQTADAQYGLNSNNSAAFQNSTDVLFILFNGPRDIIKAYQLTLDGLMQQAIADSQSVNRVQLIILAIEGALIGISAVITMWIAASLAIFRRFAIFSVFIAVPSGVIKSLATMAVDLEEGDDEEREGGDHEDAEAGGAQGSGVIANMTSGAQDEFGSSNKKAGAPAAGGKITFNAQASGEKKEAAKPTTVLGRLLSALPSFIRPAKDQGRRRRLNKSITAVLWLTWPFMLWAVFVIIINCMGYISLADISAPIAISNIVQFMAIRVNRVLLFAQRLVSEQYLDSDIGYVAAPDHTNHSALKASYRHTLDSDYQLLRLEYDAMLYGREGSLVKTETSPHFQLASTGIMFTDGADIMYNDRICFCQDVSDCQPPTSPFYRFTMNGLDQMLKELFYAVEALVLQPDSAANMKSEHFQYIYEVGNADIFGALSALTDVYSNFVIRMYSQVLTLHIVALIVCCGMGALFLLCILRPSLGRVHAEGKRVAELLSQLPAEVDVETLLLEAIKAQQTSPDAQQAALEAAAAGDEDVKAVGPAVSMNRSSHRGSMEVDSADAQRRRSTDFRRGSLDAGEGHKRASLDETGFKKP